MNLCNYSPGTRSEHPVRDNLLFISISLHHLQNQETFVFCFLFLWGSLRQNQFWEVILKFLQANYVDLMFNLLLGLGCYPSVISIGVPQEF